MSTRHVVLRVSLKLFFISLPMMLALVLIILMISSAPEIGAMYQNIVYSL
ncbi:MAG: hypothetical protein IAE83_11145 [Anaerolinea sp.]|nr:hypothetical protein [Anaerolinea sp.]MCC6972826.1 hypothetical protein [Anaerolineae bacterium]CAG1002690.1 hypothetical protein ANRL4_03290 [Anaerolineae bacterium]